MEWIVREKLSDDSRYNAGSKARMDIDTILVRKGITPLEVRVAPEDPKNESKVQKVLRHLRASHQWKKSLKSVRPGDTVYIQFPTVYFAPGLSRVLKQLQNEVTLVAFIHDLKSLRDALDTSQSNTRSDILQTEEENCLKCFAYIVTHNQSMKDWLAQHMGIAPEKMINLEIFDYLHNEKIISCNAGSFSHAVVVAGNLAREKAGYVYQLPEKVTFNLYGINYADDGKDHIRYKGAFEPDELPGRLEGGFGLVWDGPDPETCFGSFIGEYLRYNDPHKTSLYLSAGLPVIIWEKAAMAHFIQEQGCGLVISSLKEIDAVITRLTEEEYNRLRQNAWKVGEKLIKGYYTEQVLEQIRKK